MGKEKEGGGEEKGEKKGDRCSGSKLGCSILFEGVQYFNIYINFFFLLVTFLEELKHFF